MRAVFVLPVLLTATVASAQVAASPAVDVGDDGKGDLPRKDSPASESVGATRPSDGCSTAAPACFAECVPGMYRTRAGICVPREPPARRQGASAELDVDDLAAAVVTPETNLPAQTLACCLVDVEVLARGVRNLGPRADVTELAAEVRVNGQLVGKAPFRDALPAADYLVEVQYGDQVRASVVRLRSGAGRGLTAQFDLR
ncbi:MAG: hypothetical protein OXU20_35120 [Myxococcales bacterium]|nr:hypothetical protein [Myxococcales bacterium]MDD9968968.1 hypothetical protein [Myxococcales bacterium]